MDVSPDSPPSLPPPHRWMLASVLVGLFVAIVLLATSPGLPMAWDEGNAIWRARGIQRWAERVVQRRGEPFGRKAIAEYWWYTTRIEGHPPFYGIVIALGRRLSESWLDPLQSARFGPIVLFGLAAGAMFYRMGREYSAAAAVGAVGALLLMPRVFAHAHFASFDGPLTSCWVLAWALFGPARTSWAKAGLFGVVLGMALACKAPGWAAPLPFLAWTVLNRDRPGAKALAIALPVALAAFFLLNPPLWHDPIRGFETFVAMNVGRGRFNISTQFLGRMYNLDHPLPWYNTLLWTGITVPLGTLPLIVAGAGRAVRRWRAEPAGTLLLAGASTLLVLRALPLAPPHDGVRLFLPSFAFLAALAGVGVDGLLARSAPGSRALRPGRPVRWAGLVLIYAGSLSSLLWYAPQWLSYYNLAIGGLPGATALGMEPTYYWDALDRDVLDWLDRHTGPDEKVCFAAPSVENLTLMRRWGTLPVEFRAEAPGAYRWYVIQHRPSGWQSVDRRLIENARPAYQKTIRPIGWGPWRLDQPLISIYRYEAHLEAVRAAGNRGDGLERPSPG